MDPAQTRKRRRRRRQDKLPISGRLALDDHVRRDVGILSEDLFADLFPHLSPDEVHEDDVYYVAISPWIPGATPESIDWTIVAVTRSTALSHSTVQFSPSASALALQTFATSLQRVAPSKLSSHSRSGIDILVLDALALSLDTVFVSLDGELAKRLEHGEGVFHREHPIGKGSATPPSPEQKLAAAVRAALGTLRVVHSGDLFPLPLPPHPITHVPPNPGKVTLCEPVAQGILSPNTKIIVSSGRSPLKGNRDRGSRQSSRMLDGVAEADEDTANDAFFSAAEERYKTEASETADESAATSASETELSSGDIDDLSDDSLDDMISLQTPMLPSNASGISTAQAGTPMTIGRGRKTNGMATPGSVFSSFTATTARPDRPRGRLFKAQGLVKPIPAELLHPKPSAEDDDEAHIYVDVSHLSRIGCFSGDWVRVEASAAPPANGFGPFALGSFGEPDAQEPVWRPARVFGLPEGYSNRPVSRIPSSKHRGRSLSFFESQVQKSSGPLAYASPILLANLDLPSHLRLLPLKRTIPHHGNGPQSQATAIVQPPYARGVVVQQVRTPLTSSKDVEVAVIAGLKWHFEKKLRVIKAGDLIAVPIDTQLGRTMRETSNGEGSAIDNILSLAESSNSGTAASRRGLKYDEVAWFKVSHVQTQKQDAADQDEDLWGSAACVETTMAHFESSGMVNGRVPGVKDSNWPYYLGLVTPPNPGSDSLPVAICEPAPKHISALRRRMRSLLAAATSKRAIHLKAPAVAILLVSTQRNIGKATLATDTCRDIGLHTFTINAYDILNEGGGGGSDVKTDGTLKARAERALSCGPEFCALLIRHIEALTADRMATSLRSILSDARVLIATTTEPDKIPDGVRGLFTHELEMTAPDEGEREGILRSIVDQRGINLDPGVDLGGVALKTAALVAGDLVDVIDRAIVAQRSRLESLAEKASQSRQGNQPAVTLRDVQVAGGTAVRGLTKGDLDTAVEAARKNFADAIGAPKIPSVTWDDVGGLGNVKDAVMETIQLPLERPELFAKGMKKRSGILFYGPPGTGKTLLAKAIATEYSLNFFSVKGPELLNMYIGESEANVRRVFQRARDARPCVVFFDELDSVAPKRGNQGDSGGVMDRIVSQLLAELDGMSSGDDSGGGVFVIGATNRPDLLDQALLRPGRFDKLLYLGVSDTHEKQLTIMEALTRKFTLHPSVSLRAVAEKLPFTYTGADFYALCSDAMLKAVTRQASHVDAKIKAMSAERQQEITTAYFFDHFATPEDIDVMVTEEDLLAAHEELIPSVSAGELAHYERVRATFEGGRDKQQQQQQQRKDLGARTVSGASSVKGKGKGKGKAIASSSGGEEEDRQDGVNGKANKGKGKAVASGYGSGGDDEGLYD
ncbi:peroxisomal assembly protein [Pyricularia oryzae]|uniref:Peroxisomal ATPase PEX6 n=2 Tax=Pyricularia TaxID=48558 RepID=A0ABQ8P063_PYRGI|nr:peroxisomal assembly protein [Pyricularia oryzae]KAI6304637.1 peroxisomal assembly protein [Pyricularia grisea]KAH9433785.1 peroxisomal assembly protein [Pyricularia oryzae]KAI6260204.1 peroxisomal assembly protein [Pyricularia oryzae]KAI6276747.1 peroxisomal assembly protein [Pyricularia oryzae]